MFVVPVEVCCHGSFNVVLANTWYTIKKSACGIVKLGNRFGVQKGIRQVVIIAIVFFPRTELFIHLHVEIEHCLGIRILIQESS